MLRVSTFYDSDVAHVNMVARKSGYASQEKWQGDVAHVNTRLYAGWNASTKALPPRPSGRNSIENSNSVDRRGRARGLYFEGGRPARRRLPQRPLSALCRSGQTFGWRCF